MIEVLKTAEDDPNFIDEAQLIISGCVEQYNPAEFYIIRIRDLFDSKWCGFAGKMLGAFGVTNFNDLILPPFVPNRVVSQNYYRRKDDGKYESSEAPAVHIQQRSETNLKRFLQSATDDGILIWCSSGSASTGRGSLMVYNATPKTSFGWHITLVNKGRWQVETTTGISKDLLKSLRDTGLKKRKVV